MNSSVILHGHDEMLLSTRKRVLECAGLSVQAIWDARELEEATGIVLVLCYTLTTAEQACAAERYRSRNPGADILVFGEITGNTQPGDYECLGAYPGPEAFVKKVTQLVFRSRLC